MYIFCIIFQSIYYKVDMSFVELFYMPTNSRFISMHYEYVLELSALYMKKKYVIIKIKENEKIDKKIDLYLNIIFTLLNS